MTASSDHLTQPSEGKRRSGRWIVIVLIMAVLVVAGAELFCRYRLGLGDPPLLQTDPQIEYLYQPSKSYNRFGNTIAFNRWSMRSDDFPEHKTDPRELRILFLGDSVINGGMQITQPDLASEIVRSELPARIGNRPVVVGNASAGSWGPTNMLAYAKKFGFFDADIVVIVLSSDDWDDMPEFGELSVDQPTRKPILALEEAIARYLPRYLPGARTDADGPQPSLRSPDDPRVVAALADLRALIELAHQTGAIVAIAQHIERGESLDQPKPGHDAIMQVAREAGAKVIQLGPSFAQAQKAGMEPYRDRVHPNPLGQRIIAQTIMDWIVANVRDRQTSATMPATSPH